MIYKCEKCNKVFNQKNDYRRHMNKKKPCLSVSKIECNFTCPHCNKIYTRNDNLMRHINVFCKYSNTQKNNKLKQFTENENIYTDLTPMKNNNNDILDIEKIKLFLLAPKIKNLLTYKCEHCDSNFSTQYNLQRHQNGRCKNKTKFDNDQIIIKQLLNEMNESREKIKNIEKKNEELQNKLLLLENNNQSNIINNNSNNNNNISNNTN